MDSIVITAQKSGFDIDEFIEMVQKDESFYQAFRNIRTQNYSSDNDIRMFNKKGNEIASYQSNAIQTYEDSCREMIFKDQKSTGKFYKKGNKKYKYNTAKMYDRLFFTQGKKCKKKNTNPSNPKAKKGMEKYVEELKKLIFKPGESIDVPGLKNKTAIFSKNMIQYYDYRIESKKYEGDLDCYVFTIEVKEKYKSQKKKTVIKFLETYFSKEDFQVIARSYTLAYQSAIYDFDIDMNIKLQKVNALYVPSFIAYDGWWDIPTKKPEIARFKCGFSDYN